MARTRCEIGTERNSFSRVLLLCNEVARRANQVDGFVSALGLHLSHHTKKISSFVAARLAGWLSNKEDGMPMMPLCNARDFPAGGGA